MKTSTQQRAALWAPLGTLRTHFCQPCRYSLYFCSTWLREKTWPCVIFQNIMQQQLQSISYDHAEHATPLLDSTIQTVNNAWTPSLGDIWRLQTPLLTCDMVGKHIWTGRHFTYLHAWNNAWGFTLSFKSAMWLSNFTYGPRTYNLGVRYVASC